MILGVLALPRWVTGQDVQVAWHGAAPRQGSFAWVIVAAAHLPGKVPEEKRLSEEGLVAGIVRLGTEASFIPTVDAIVEALVAEVRPGDRVAILSNGGFGGIHDKLLRALEAAART